MGIHTPRVWNQTLLQSEPHKIGISYSRHIPGELMIVESHYTFLRGASKLFTRLVMQSLHLMTHFIHYLVVSLPLVQLVWEGSSIIFFIRMYSTYTPNWSPISIYHPTPVILSQSEFDILFNFLTLPFGALYTNLLQCHAYVNFDTATDRVLFLSDKQ